MSKDICPICEEITTNVIMNNYDEPPESKISCERCGFNEYYFYYEGFSTYMTIAIPKSENPSKLELKGILIETSEKNFISRDEYKEMFISYLKKNNMTLDSIIEDRKKFKEQESNKKKMLKLEEEKKQARWKAGDLLENETYEINSFLLRQKEIIKDLGEVVKITKEEMTPDGLLFNLEFEIDEKELSKLVSYKSRVQKEYCVANKVPMFAPISSCYSCGCNIFSLRKTTVNMFGKSLSKIEEFISLKKCSTDLITGCPSCNRSYVD